MEFVELCLEIARNKIYANDPKASMSDIEKAFEKVFKQSSQTVKKGSSDVERA